MSYTPAQLSGASEDDDAIPIRMIEAATFCPRQAWYRFVAGDDPINVHMQRGLNRHEIFAQQPIPGEGSELSETARVWRHLAVRAPRLGVAGVLDELHVLPDKLVITEFKATHLSRVVYEGVLMQLCVQYLALREHARSGAWLGGPLPDTAILRVYYTDSRRAREVMWNSELESRARAAIAYCREILMMSSPPAGFVGQRCRECQHEPICLPFDLPVLKEAAHDNALLD